MPTVTFQPSGKTVTVGEGTTLLSAAQQGGQDILHFCGGNALCQTCEIRIDPTLNTALAAPTTEELRWLSTEDIAAGHRLACCSRVKSNLTVTLPAEIRKDIAGQFEHLSFGEGVQLWFRLLGRSFDDFAHHVKHGPATLLNAYEIAQKHGVGELLSTLQNSFSATLKTGVMVFEAVMTGVSHSMETLQTPPDESPAAARKTTGPPR